MAPPDEISAADPTGAAWVAWLVITGPGLVLVALLLVRRVVPGQRILVVRRGVVVRARTSGLVVRWPVLERFVPVATDGRVVPLVTRARTSDGVDVVVLSDLAVGTSNVGSGTRWVPLTQVARVAEDTIGSEIARLPVRSLVDDLDTLQRSALDCLARQLPVGTTAAELAITEVEAQLTPRVADVLSERREGGASC